MQADYTDVVIIGGGVLGVWVANLLKKRGINILLVEKNTIGGKQSLNSQGILHGGLKYALNGMLSNTSEVIAKMPAIWDKHLKGQTFPDLSEVEVFSDYNYMFTHNSMLNNIASFFTSKLLTGRVDKLKVSEYPDVFHESTVGQLFKLNEKVVDVQGVVQNLYKNVQEDVFKIDNIEIAENNKKIENIILFNKNQKAVIKAKKYIFTAGEGNQQFSELSLPKTQLRPLHMSLVLGDLPLLYAHCIEASNKPRITITSHRLGNQVVWYLGGQIAEKGVNFSEEQQVQYTKKELKTLFPKINQEGLVFKTFRINRAEPENNNEMPSNSYYKHFENKVIAWPTKLVLVPQVASDIAREIQVVKTSKHQLQWEKCSLGQPCWHQLFEEYLCSTEI